MQEDDRRTYYLTGVVWRTLFKDYHKKVNTNVIAVMKAQFVSRKEATRASLPVGEVAVKYVPVFLFTRSFACVVAFTLSLSITLTQVIQSFAIRESADVDAFQGN